MKGPDPSHLFPFGKNAKHTVFLKPLLEAKPTPHVRVGEYSYYSDFDDPTRFYDRNVRYNFSYSKAELVIGKFCAIAHGATFVMADANHPGVGPSTYPFPVFGQGWADEVSVEQMPLPAKRDIVLGHDVWVGYESMILPGVTVGTGAIVGARAVVAKDVPPYTVVVGSPARIVKRRFDDATVEKLLAIAWWDWPAERIARAIPSLLAGKPEDLLAR
jgi:virginiamycin A acetyltransferase